MTRSFWPAQEDEAIAALRADLQTADLLLSSLRQPSDDGAGRVALDELFSYPQPLAGRLGLDPDELPFIHPIM
jgi:hypothetical protein